MEDKHYPTIDGKMLRENLQNAKGNIRAGRSKLVINFGLLPLVRSQAIEYGRLNSGGDKLVATATERIGRLDPG